MLGISNQLTRNRLSFTQDIAAVACIFLCPCCRSGGLFRTARHFRNRDCHLRHCAGDLFCIGLLLLY
ncbi:Uncharacterised protein [Vibrio cholerae]|nr:Uncharacterised protein [Vibrio cholerae]